MKVLLCYADRPPVVDLLSMVECENSIGLSIKLLASK